MIQRALQEGPFNLRDIAEDIGGSYGTVRDWARGARTPIGENVERIASAFEARAERLRKLAADLRSANAEDDGTD